MPNNEQLLRTIEELRAERMRIDRALVELEALTGSARARPLTKAKGGTGKWSQAARAQASKRMREYWAAKKRRNLR